MRWAAIRRLWPLLLPALLLLPGIFAFPYPPADAVYSDLALAHYPYTVYIRESLAEYGRLPLWSALIFGGAPLAANPLSGLWYPPGWLSWLLPLPFGFNLLVILHLVFGGVGVYRLAQAEGLSHPAALFSGLAFELLPKLFAHYGAGHLSLLYAVPWTPWLLLAFRRDARALRWYFSPWSALVLALTFLADVRWAAYAGLLWLAYVFAHWPSVTRHGGQFVSSPGAIHLSPARQGLKQGIQVAAYLLLQLFQAFLLALPLALPLMVFVWQSSRRWMSAADFLAYSLPLGRLLGLVFPDFGGFHEFTLYPGAMVLCLALMALASGVAFRRARFWAMVFVLALLFSLGEAIPGLGWLRHLPLVGLLRVPSRALFLVGLALAFLAAYALQALLGGLSNKEQRRGSLLLVTLASFALALAAGLGLVTGAPAGEFLWGGLALLLGAVWLIVGMAKRLPSNAWLVGIFVLCMVDMGVVDLSLYTSRPASGVLAEGADLAKALAQEPGMFRIYSPSVSLPQYTAVNYHLELTDGVDPMQFGDYVRFMQRATGVPQAGYSVTLPPFASGTPGADNADYLPDPALLGLLNVRFVAAEFDLAVDGLQQVGSFGVTRLYENLYALPRAWVQPANALPGEQAQSVQSIDWQPNRIVISARGPGLLVLSEVDYSGWRLEVDGKKESIQRVAGLLRGVELGPGEHTVVFSYFPDEVKAGLAGQLLCLLWLLVAWQLRKDKEAKEI